MDDISSSVVESVPDIPVTVKMRSGWNKESIVIPEAGERLEKIGVKAITLHPRTTVQSYLGQADWSLIKELKQTVSIPVFGNGDVSTPERVISMFEDTGCDAVMVGRGALGNPWFFRDALALLKGEPLPEKFGSIPGAPPPEPTQPPPGQPKGKIDPVAGLGAFIKAMNRSEKEHHLLRTNIEQMLETIRRGLGK